MAESRTLKSMLGHRQREDAWSRQGRGMRITSNVTKTKEIRSRWSKMSRKQNSPGRKDLKY